MEEKKLLDLQAEGTKEELVKALRKAANDINKGTLGVKIDGEKTSLAWTVAPARADGHGEGMVRSNSGA